MNNTIIGVYDDRQDAALANATLQKQGIAQSQIRMVRPEDMQAGRTRSDYQDEDLTFGEQISAFFSSLFGSDDEEVLGPRYLEAVRRGSTLVVVDVDDDKEVQVAERVMSEHRTVDIDQRDASWRKQGWSNYDENAPLYSEDEIKADRAAESATLTETQEELKVGKRRENDGRVKVFKRVSEDKVEDSVELESQRAVVRRRTVDRPATAADGKAFEEGAVEVKQFSEEAVAEKTTRVTGEVDVGIDRTKKTKTVSDTVRSTEVEVEGDAEVIKER